MAVFHKFGGSLFSGDIMSKQSLIKPQAGQTEQCVVQHGHVYALGFDTSNVTFGRSEGDLLLTFEDGANIVLRDFYNESQIGDFFLELADGNVLSARTVIESMEYILDDFGTGTDPVYTAESFQPVHDVASSILSIFGEEDASLLAQSTGLSSLDGLIAEDSISVNTGALTPVANHSESPGVFDPHANSSLAHNSRGQNDLDMDGQDPAGEFASHDLGTGTLLGEGGLDLDDEPSLSAYVMPQAGDHATTDIITPRAGADGVHNPFSGHPGVNEGIIEDGSGAKVLFATNSKEADLLLLEDLLDTTMPEDMNTGTERVPAFEDLFASAQEEGLSMKIDSFSYVDVDHINTVTASDSVSDGSEQLLLAFLRMGSF